MPLFGNGRGPLGLPTRINWKWIVAGASTGLVAYAIAYPIVQNGEFSFTLDLAYSIVIFILVVLWLRSS